MNTLYKKYYVVFILITFYCFESKSQWIEYLSIFPENPTINYSVSIISVAGFPFGYESTCPELKAYSCYVTGNNIHFNSYYDISGAWPQAYCYTVDTNSIGQLNSGFCKLYYFLNTIFDSDTNFMVDSDSLEFTVINSNDVNESELVKKLVVYPNPAREYFVFQVPGSIMSSARQVSEIVITDVWGQEVERLTLNAEKKVWDCKQMKAGVYFYFLEMEGKRYSGKVVINKQSQ
jgi:hypothetical protein